MGWVVNGAEECRHPVTEMSHDFLGAEHEMTRAVGEKLPEGRFSGSARLSTTYAEGAFRQRVAGAAASHDLRRTSVLAGWSPTPVPARTAPCRGFGGRGGSGATLACLRLGR